MFDNLIFKLKIKIEIFNHLYLIFNTEHGSHEQTTRSSKDGSNNERVRKTKHEDEYDR